MKLKSPFQEVFDAPYEQRDSLLSDPKVMEAFDDSGIYCIESEGFFYALDNNMIKIENIFVDEEDVKKIKAAIETLSSVEQIFGELEG